MSDTFINSFNDGFETRHIGPSQSEQTEMLKQLKVRDLDELISQVLPPQIKQKSALKLVSEKRSETEMLKDLNSIATKNLIFRSFIGMGYSGCNTPPIIQRGVLENPGWYTQYTPYQSEISQGRLEALLNFQTMVSDLTGLEVSNASLLDEATAAAEAMFFCFSLRSDKDTEKKSSRRVFWVSELCHPQVIAVVQTRAKPLGIEVVVGDHVSARFDETVFGVLLQYPATNGRVFNFENIVSSAHQSGALVVMAADILALTLLRSPGELGADVAIGNTQRFGVPLGFGGPHAAYFATREVFKRRIPGRIVGVSKDRQGKVAYRLALQTREQHIRRDKATSNICTAQVLLAVIASMYAVYHGPKGLKHIALKVHRLTSLLASELSGLGVELQETSNYFDTLCVELKPKEFQEISKLSEKKRINFRLHDSYYNVGDKNKGSGDKVGISLDETSELADVEDILLIFGADPEKVRFSNLEKKLKSITSSLDTALFRKSEFLTHPVFGSHQSETKMLRYLKRLEAKDLSLTTSMIPLGSCTMKLNAAAEMFPVTWPHFSSLHPFVPAEQSVGYRELFSELEKNLAEITGFSAVSLQPNAGSQGEYAGLMVIKKYLEENGQGNRDVCLIPKSAHGTNPASAILAGMQVKIVDCDKDGNIDVSDLREKISQNAKSLAALMVTYPSTHGVFETTIKEVCDLIHQAGGQVYLDGANLNAQVGLCRPGDYGADVCHVNLHKTFCIPHGGGGPGMGPIGVAKHLVSYLPQHAVVNLGRPKGIGTISSAPWGSPSILPISWAYIRMMGAEGLKNATQVAILNANYIASRLDPHFPVLYKGKAGWVAHECILDLRQIKAECGVDVEDVAKRLMDYGFHAPTISFPVAGTCMIEPTESESKDELDRFCEAMISIRKEIQAVQDGKADQKNNFLKNAPHTSEMLAGPWDYPYSREEAAFPAPWLRDYKYWPPVGRIDNVFGDRHLICSCPPLSAYES